MKNTDIFLSELTAFIAYHASPYLVQDNGIAILCDITLANGDNVKQWDYVTTYTQARQALGY